MISPRHPRVVLASSTNRGTLKLLQFPLHLTSPDINCASLATHAALLDEFTTWALVLADGRAGVSVNLQAHRAPPPLPDDGGEDGIEQQLLERQQQQSFNNNQKNDPCWVDLEATVTKIGRNLGFVRGAIYWHPGGAGASSSSSSQSKQQQPQKRRLLSHGSQVKYLPMGFLTDFALSQRGWPLTKLYSEHCLSDPESPPSTNVLESLQICPETTATTHRFDERLRNDENIHNTIATFQATPAHASLGGTIHGGCQAVLMERAADEFVRRLLRKRPHHSAKLQSNPPTSFQLESISVDYLSTPSRHVGLRVVETIPSSPSLVWLVQEPHSRLTLRVQLFNVADGRVSSEGLLRYCIKMEAKM